MNEHTEKYNCKNTKLETDNYNIGREYGYRDGYLAAAESREKRIEQLEKENAELKEQCSILADCNTCYSPCKNENVEIKKQLTKAKGIIKDLLHCLHKESIEGVYEVTEEAEQFIRE